MPGSKRQGASAEVLPTAHPLSATCKRPRILRPRVRHDVFGPYSGSSSSRRPPTISSCVHVDPPRLTLSNSRFPEQAGRPTMPFAAARRDSGQRTTTVAQNLRAAVWARREAHNDGSTPSPSPSSSTRWTGSRSKAAPHIASDRGPWAQARGRVPKGPPSRGRRQRGRWLRIRSRNSRRVRLAEGKRDYNADRGSTRTRRLSEGDRMFDKAGRHTRQQGDLERGARPGTSEGLQGGGRGATARRWGWIARLYTTSSCSCPARNGTRRTRSPSTRSRRFPGTKKINTKVWVAALPAGGQTVIRPSRPRATRRRSILQRRKDLSGPGSLVQGEIVHVHGRTDFLERRLPAKKSS